MKTLPLREAKASLSALIDAAEHGEATTITKHGRPAAVLVPIDAVRHLYPAQPSFAEYLLSFPGFPDGFAPERNPSPGREVDL